MKLGEMIQQTYWCFVGEALEYVNQLTGYHSRREYQDFCVAEAARINKIPGRRAEVRYNAKTCALFVNCVAIPG